MILQGTIFVNMAPKAKVTRLTLLLILVACMDTDLLSVSFTLGKGAFPRCTLALHMKAFITSVNTPCVYVTLGSGDYF